MHFSDIQLSQRLERAEGNACAQFAAARQELFPNSGSQWIECAGAYAVFDGVDSPVTQSFGLGIFEELNATSLDSVEEFFVTRGAPVLHEISPFAGVAAMDLLCKRNYRPIELSSVLLPRRGKTKHRTPGKDQGAHYCPYGGGTLVERKRQRLGT